MNAQDYPIAIVGNGLLTSSYGSREIPVNLVHNVVELAEWALGPVQPLRAIWIAPGSEFAEMAAHDEFWQNADPRWKVFATGPQDATFNVAAVRRDGKGVTGDARREVNIYAGMDTRWMLPDLSDSPEWATVQNKHLHWIGLIRGYEQQMGPARMSPANTAIKLMETMYLNCDRAAWIDPLSTEALRGIPWPGNRAPAHVNRWVGDGKYVHVFDKSSAHVASYPGLMGRGDPMLQVNDSTPPDKMWSPLFYPFEWSTWIQKEQPALWRISARPPLDTPPMEREKLPSPFNAHGDVPDHEWYYGPQVKLALEMGYQVALHEVYVWKNAHNTLGPWSERIWKARQALKGTPVEAMIKASYTQAEGVMSRPPREGERQRWYHRPDWVGLFVARHYHRQVKKIMQLKECGIEFLAVSTDSVAIVSNQADPMMAIPVGWTGKPGQQLGVYRHEATYQGAQAQQLIELAGDGFGAARLYKLMNEWD